MVEEEGGRTKKKMRRSKSRIGGERTNKATHVEAI
jgi:hypothetical protein